MDHKSVTMEGEDDNTAENKTTNKNAAGSLGNSEVDDDDILKSAAHKLWSSQEEIKNGTKIIVCEGYNANKKLSASHNYLISNDSQSICSQLSECVKMRSS